MDRELVEGGPLPVRDASLFVFTTAKVPEAVLRLERHGGILVACDSLQSLVLEPGKIWVDAATVGQPGERAHPAARAPAGRVEARYR